MFTVSTKHNPFYINNNYILTNLAHCKYNGRRKMK